MKVAIATPVKPTRTPMGRTVLALAVAAINPAVVPVQQPWAAWAVWLAFVLTRAAAPAAFQVESDGSKAAWIIVLISSPV